MLIAYTTKNNWSPISVVDIIHFEAANKSTNMEKLGFQKGLKDLNKQIPIRRVVTDAHPQIIPLMRDYFQWIIHQIDIWHRVW